MSPYQEEMPTLVEVFRDWHGEYRWRLIADDGRTLYTSFPWPTQQSAIRDAEREESDYGVRVVKDI